MASAAASGMHRAEPDVVAPPPLHPKFPLSDGMRGIAAVSVLLVHTWLFTNGFGGLQPNLPNRFMVRLDAMVAIFFMLSAFLLYRPMIAHRGGGPASPTVGDYLRRRLLRIYPPFWVVLTALAIFPGLYGVFTEHWWSFYSLGYYFHPVYADQGCPGTEGFLCGLPQVWTLTVEMTFYLVLPLYALATAMIARRYDLRTWVRAELVLLACLAAISLLMNHWFRHDAWFEFSFIGHIFWISLGLGMAVLSAAYGHGRLEVLPRPIRFAAQRPGMCWAAALAIYLVTVFAFYPAPFPVAPMPSAEYLALNLLQGIGAGLLVIPIVFGNPNRGAPARVLATPLLLWLGLISYGLYLWQVTIQVHLGVGGAEASFVPVLMLTLLIAIPLSALTYYFVERPCMKLKYRPFREVFGRRRRRSGPASLEPN
jgi:peptidoglycan/LPS O-acetylase OafA/YrhL